METVNEQLILQSTLSDLKLVAPWIERLAARHSFSDQRQFAIDLCLEEVISNVIRHGYAERPGHFISVRFSSTPHDDYFAFTIEDEAPHFDPLSAPEPPLMTALDQPRIGGNGIRLLRHFADKIEYSATATGNRLVVGFRSAPSSASDPSSFAD